MAAFSFLLKEFKGNFEEIIIIVYSSSRQANEAIFKKTTVYEDLNMMPRRNLSLFWFRMKSDDLIPSNIINAVILKSIKVPKNLHNRFTEKYANFLSSQLIKDPTLATRPCALLLPHKVLRKDFQITRKSGKIRQWLIFRSLLP